MTAWHGKRTPGGWGSRGRASRNAVDLTGLVDQWTAVPGKSINGCRTGHRTLSLPDLRTVDHLGWSTAGRSTVPDSDICLLYTSPSPRDGLLSRMPSSA